MQSFARYEPVAAKEIESLMNQPLSVQMSEVESFTVDKLKALLTYWRIPARSNMKLKEDYVELVRQTLTGQVRPEYDFDGSGYGYFPEQDPYGLKAQSERRTDTFLPSAPKHLDALEGTSLQVREDFVDTMPTQEIQSVLRSYGVDAPPGLREDEYHALADAYLEGRPVPMLDFDGRSGSRSRSPGLSRSRSPSLSRSRSRSPATAALKPRSLARFSDAAHRELRYVQFNQKDHDVTHVVVGSMGSDYADMEGELNKFTKKQLIEWALAEQNFTFSEDETKKSIVAKLVAFLMNEESHFAAARLTVVAMSDAQISRALNEMGISVSVSQVKPSRAKCEELVLQRFLMPNDKFAKPGQMPFAKANIRTSLVRGFQTQESRLDVARQAAARMSGSRMPASVFQVQQAARAIKATAVQASVAVQDGNQKAAELAIQKLATQSAALSKVQPGSGAALEAKSNVADAGKALQSGNPGKVIAKLEEVVKNAAAVAKSAEASSPSWGQGSVNSLIAAEQQKKAAAANWSRMQDAMMGGTGNVSSGIDTETLFKRMQSEPVAIAAKLKQNAAAANWSRMQDEMMRGQ